MNNNKNTEARIPLDVVEMLITKELTPYNGTAGIHFKDAVKKTHQETLVQQGRASLVLDLIDIYNKQNPERPISLSVGITGKRPSV